MEENKQTNITSDANNLTTEESFRVLYDTAPKPIQDFLRKKKYESVADEFIHVYGLNTEQTNSISSELVLMLIGAKSPDEFLSSIKKIEGIRSDIVEKIINDINRLVFTPIQKQIELAKKTQTETENKQQKQKVLPIQNTVQKREATTINQQNKLSNNADIVYTKMPPPVAPLPNKDTLISKSPIVKEYSSDPYREPTN